VVERFRTISRPSDLLSRLGGDEFGLLSYNVDREAARSIGLRFITALDSEIRTGGLSHRVGASIGVALVPDDGTTAEEIIHNADLAMYSAKKEERSSLVFFNATARHRRQLT
jgi:diguanylate cyclase (GGDEF)-like protein